MSIHDPRDSETIRCPYGCPWENLKVRLLRHYQEAHPAHIIHNNSYSIITQLPPPHLHYLLNECEGEVFLSKCRKVGPRLVEFSTSCLTRAAPVAYELVFYPRKSANPTLTRTLQTGNGAVTLDLDRISANLGFMETVECSFRKLH